MKKTSIFAAIQKEDLKKIKKTKQPTFIKPMLATLTTDYFSSNEWVFEDKFDGIRCLAFKNNGKVTLKSRNNRVINAEYPTLVTGLENQQADNFIIDGEIAALDEQGVSNFQLLQGRINLKSADDITQQETIAPVIFYIFDVMYAEGYDIRRLTLLDRKAILKKLLTYRSPLSYSKHRATHGLKFFKQACALHWEGIMAKKIDSTYVSRRSSAWLKFKCIMQQELVIIGYTEPRASRTDFGALLVGYYKGKKLYYAGKVGTGYDQETLQMLGKKLRALTQKTSVVVNYTEPLKGVYWVKPVLVAEFEFANWTTNNKLRVGRYKGLRVDKPAHQVKQELPG